MCMVHTLTLVKQDFITNLHFFDLGRNEPQCQSSQVEEGYSALLF
jgi:hypothetical protein